MKEKTIYQAPTITVVEVKQQSRLLAGSDRSSSAGVTNYTWQDVTEE